MVHRPRSNTDVFGELLPLIGEDALFKLLQQWGGQRIGVPRRVGPDTRLALVIGAENAAKMAREYGGGKIGLPLAKPWRCLMMRRAGHSYGQISARLCISEASVHQHLKRLGMTKAAAS